MKVLEPKELKKRRDHRVKSQKSKRRKRSITPLLIVILAIYVIASLAIPIPSLRANVITPKMPAASLVNLPWPSYGQAAIGAVGYGSLAQNGEQKPLPIASVAKVLTVLAVLKARPIMQGEQGDIITITAYDVATYNANASEGQSVVLVEEGEQITEYQALQALLLPSANNMADVLVRWVFGSTDDYLVFVNKFAKTLGMANTSIDDASGFSPKTTSTADDLTKLAEIAMNNPVITEIIAMPQAEIPVAGTIYNVNNQIGSNGIIGIKTGNTDEAGGCYMFAAKRKIDDKNSVVVVGVIMGGPDRSSAIADSLPLLDEAFRNFKVIKPVATNQIVGTVSQPGGEKVPVIVQQDVSVVTWSAQSSTAEINMNELTTKVDAGAEVGTLTLYVGNMTYNLPLVTALQIGDRTPLWRLQHAGGYI